MGVAGYNNCQGQGQMANKLSVVDVRQGFSKSTFHSEKYTRIQEIEFMFFSLSFHQMANSIGLSPKSATGASIVELLDS